MKTSITKVTDDVRAAYRQSRNTVTRRMGIYESDGTTEWLPSVDTERLIAGTINLSYDRNERRMLNGLQIANDDGYLKYSQNGFWYDKILKFYRGIIFGDYWFEAQIGEFMIDKIDAPKFPHVITVTGRDYTKKLLNDKFAEDTTFVGGGLVDDLIKTIATNGGISKFRLNSGGKVLTTSVSIDKNTSRWDAITSFTEPLGIDVYFSADGYLISEYTTDVSTSGPFIRFGSDSLTDGYTYPSRSISDSNIYNDLVVVSTNQNAVSLGIAPLSRWQNTDKSSATNIYRIGRRSARYESDLFLTTADTDAYLNTWKKTAALETWEISFGFRYLPWIEVGKVIELPDENLNIPARYLLTDLDCPIGLGVVSGTGKRLTLIG